MAGLRKALGLDLPVHERYLNWLGGLLTGDPGRSLVNNVPVATLIGNRLPNSLMLAAVTAAVSVPIALLIGITAAVWRGSVYDRAVSVLSVSVVSVPEFLVATAAVLVFAVHLRWLSALSLVSEVTSFGQFLRVFAMPVLSLCCVIIAQMVRMTRAAVIDQLDSPYVEMAVLKGAGPRARRALATPCRTRSARSPTRWRSASPTCSAASSSSRRSSTTQGSPS